MPLDLTTRSGKGSPVSAVESDQNLTDIETLVNALEVLVSDEDVDALASRVTVNEVDIDDAESDIVGHTADIADHETRVTTNEAHAAASSGNPHSVNKANVGLGNVSNDLQIKAIDFEQILLVGKHGNDSNSGASHQDAFLTFGAAITAANALTPSSTNRIAIRCIDAADYTENLTLLTWCGILAPAAKIIGNHILGDNSLISSFRLIASSGIAVKKNVGTGAATVICPRMLLSGTAKGLVCETGTINYTGHSVEVENGIGFGFESVATVHITINTIEITGTGTGIGLEAAGKIVAVCGNISDSGSGTGIKVENGGTVNINMADLVCNTVYDVDATSTLNLICAYLSGTETNAGTANVLVASDVIHATEHENAGDDEISVAGLSGLLADNQNPTAHAAEHVDGTDDIQNATSGQKGLATAAQITKLDAIEAAADVTDAVNIASSIHGVAEKATPVNADEVGLIDSAAANVLKKLTWANIKATMKTYMDTLYLLATTKLDDLATPDDNTDLNATTSEHGLLKKLSNVTTEFMNGQGNWAEPAGGGGGNPADVCSFSLSNNANQLNIAVGSVVTVIFGSEKHDVGNDFASNIFTAPTTAMYQLDMLIQLSAVPTDCTSLYFRIMTSNDTFSAMVSPSRIFSSAATVARSISIMCDMDANDTAKVEVYQFNGTLQTDLYSGNAHFSGFQVTT